MDDYLKANKKWWNKATSVHLNSKFYDVKGFKKGKTALNFVELEEIGNVKGKNLLHLQCHFGMGTISWAREGTIATGVDLSDKSIKLAKKLSQEVGVPANFICSDIYSLPDVLNEKFDIVFTSYGVLGWLPDLKKWAKVINHFLKPGGIFYIVEIHPLTGIFGKNLKIGSSYFQKEPFIEESWKDYADNTVDIKNKAYEWNHTLSDVVNSLLEEGLKIKFLNEFPFTVYEQFPGLMEQNPDGIFKFKDKNVQIPLLFSLKAIKD